MTTVASALIVLALLPPVAAQDPVEEERLDPEQVRAARASVDTVLDEALRAQLVELFDAALGELEQIELDRLKIERFADQVEGVDDRIEELRGELENFENGERVGLADDVGPDEAHRELGLERERLAAHREALRTAEQRSEDRAATRTDVSRRLGELDQTVEAIEKELRGVRESDLGPELREAMQTHLQARGEAAKSRIGSLRAELAWIESRARLMPWEIDLAERGVTHSEQLVAALESRSRRLMRAESNTALERAIATCDEATALSPVLQPIAEELRSLAELRWGEGSVVALSDRTSAALLATRKHRDDLDRVIQLTRRLYVAYGRQGSIGRWWPQLPEGFPSSAEVERRILEVQIEVPEVQHHLIRFEQARSKSRALHEETLAALRAEGDRVDPRAEEVGFDLLNLRRDLLEELTAEAGRYTDQLVEYESSLVYLRDQMGRVETFLFERVLWSRSVPRPVIPSPKSIGEGFTWLFSADHLRALFGAIRRGVFRTDVVLWVIAVVALVLLRTRIRNRLHTLADQIADPDREVLLATLRAAVQTVLLAAPLPLALLAASHMFRGSTGVWVADAASRALLFTASIAALFEGVRQVAAPRGLGQAHFGWNPGVLRRVHRGLLVPEMAFLPIIALALHFVFVGVRLVSPTHLQAHHNTLGRFMFIAALVILGGSLAAVARPRWPNLTAPGGLAVRRTDVGIQLSILLSTILPAALAALGFYVTAILIAYQALRMAWLAFGVILAAGMIARWMAIRERRRRSALAGAEPDAEAVTAESQTRGFLQFMLAVVVAIGLYGIWSDAFPMLGMLKRVELWPRFQVSDPIRDPLEEADLRGPEDVPPAERAPDAATRPEGLSLPGVGSGGAVAPATESAPLTLWNLLQAILVAIVVTVLTRSLPGVIDLLLRRRENIDRGARVAFTTLVRYTILIVGVSTVFGLLGVSWSKVQWLAAALTFGLGFGLQEIVANFVSGLILLLERPVRVGDAVTVGNLGGIVSQIQIRATTITLWDRSEMIVPNKEFITTKLINWTLSNSNRRSEIAIRVAHGTDIQQVKETLIEVARNHPNVHDDPPPHVLLMDFADDAIKLELRYFVDFGEGLGTKDGLLTEIDSAFRERGIVFAMPRLDIDLPRRTPSKRSDDASGPTGEVPPIP